MNVISDSPTGEPETKMSVRLQNRARPVSALRAMQQEFGPVSWSGKAYCITEAQAKADWRQWLPGNKRYVMSQDCSVRRIKKIGAHIAAKSYLEIGVFEGKTFHSLDFPRQVAVDPKFQFDIAARKRDGSDYFEMTSDKYFTTHAGSEKFDIIFLDGRHTFQQTFRDFCNSLTCAHDGTVWLIDDIRPSDEHCAMPTHRQAMESRTKAGLPGKGGWCGDTFKVIFAIHDFFPRFTYTTLGLPGRPQALLWSCARRDFHSALDSMEKIEKLTWFDMVERDAIFNSMAEGEGFTFFRELYSTRGNGEVISPVFPARIPETSGSGSDKRGSGGARLRSWIARRMAR